VQSVIPYHRSLATNVYFEKCITKTCNVGHSPFLCSAVSTTLKGNHTEQLYPVQPLPQAVEHIGLPPFQ